MCEKEEDNNERLTFFRHCYKLNYWLGAPENSGPYKHHLHPLQTHYKRTKTSHIRKIQRFSRNKFGSFEGYFCGSSPLAEMSDRTEVDYKNTLD